MSQRAWKFIIMYDYVCCIYVKKKLAWTSQYTKSINKHQQQKTISIIRIRTNVEIKNFGFGAGCHNSVNEQHFHNIIQNKPGCFEKLTFTSICRISCGLFRKLTLFYSYVLKTMKHISICSVPYQVTDGLKYIQSPMKIYKQLFVVRMSNVRTKALVTYSTIFSDSGSTGNI